MFAVAAVSGLDIGGIQRQLNAGILLEFGNRHIARFDRTDLKYPAFRVKMHHGACSDDLQGLFMAEFIELDLHVTYMAVGQFRDSVYAIGNLEGTFAAEFTNMTIVG